MVGAAREGRHFLMLATEVGAEFDRFQEATYIETLEHIRNYFEVPIEKHEQVYDSFFDINRYDALWEQMDESVKFCKNMPMFSNLSKTQKEQVLLSVSSVVANVLDTKLPMREQMDVSRLEEDMQLFRTKLLAMNMSAPKTHFAMELYSRMSEMVQEVRISADVEHNRSYDEEVILMMANTHSEIRDAERQRIRFTDIHQFDGNSQVLKEQVVAVGKGKMLKEYFDLLQYRGLDDVKSELLAADKRLHVTLGKYQITDPVLGELFQSCVKDTFDETMKATSYQLDGNHFGKKIIQHLQEKRIRQNCQETGTFERNVRRVAGHSREAL
jgi:hypothetical protein